MVKIFSQLNTPPIEREVVDTNDLGVLDKVSITSVVDFMRKFQSDASFTPPTVDIMFESDNYNVGIDDDVDSIFSDDTSILSDIDDLKNARDESK